MCERPVEFSCLGVDGAERKRAVADPSYWNDLGIITRGENLIGFLKILVVKVFSITVYPVLRKSPITLWRVIPARKVPFGMGVNTLPSFARNTFDVASSATLPNISQTSALSKPRSCASKSARELLG